MESRTFALAMREVSSPCGFSVRAEWQTGYFDIGAGCTGPKGCKRLPLKAFKRLVVEEQTESGHPSIEPMRKVVLCAPQLFCRWAHHAGVPEGAANSISKSLLALHRRHLFEVSVGSFYGLSRIQWLKSLTFEGDDPSNYAALRNWTMNARTIKGEPIVFCSIPVKEEATRDVDWLLSILVRPNMRAALYMHAKESGCIVWEELENDMHHFYNVKSEDMMSLVSSYTGPGCLLLQAVFYNAKILELTNLGRYPKAPIIGEVLPFQVPPPTDEVEDVVKRLLERPAPFPVDWKDVCRLADSGNPSRFKASFRKRVLATCKEADYLIDGPETRLTLFGLRDFCNSCRDPSKKRRLGECFEGLSK